MLEVEKPADMKAHIGKQIGTSDWVTVDQPMIDKFAEATGDHQWIHVDVERAKKDMPGGKTIAHGFLTLSLIPMLNHQISHINNVRNGINYGCNKVRFTSPVPAGSITISPRSISGALLRQWILLKWPASSPSCNPSMLLPTAALGSFGGCRLKRETPQQSSLTKIHGSISISRFGNRSALGSSRA
jgi:hypothetical protein